MGGWRTGQAVDLWPVSTNVSATSDSYSCEPVTLTVWSMGRRHRGHWRDEKFHLLSLGQVGCSWVTEKERRRWRKKRKRTRNKDWSGHLCLSWRPPSCLYGGLKLPNSRVPLCHAPPGSLLGVESEHPELEGHTHLPQSANIHCNEILISQKVCVPAASYLR